MTVESRTPVAARMAGTALTIASAIGFGTSGPLARMAMDAGMTALQVATVRITLAAVLLAATLPLRGLSGLRGVRWRTLTGYALLAVVGVQVLFFIAVARIPVGIAMTLEFTAPVLVSLWIRVVRRIRLPVHVWTGITLATAGLAVVAQIWDGFRLDLIGLLAGLGTGLCTAGYYLLGEHIAGRADPLALTTCGMVLGAVAIGFVCP
ncbi:MAG: DMT family transporter, partial [Kutzneria sp.]|nr:DMT family transporter [Kutzneria sp.]